MNRITPMKAIRLKCRECFGGASGPGVSHEIERCTDAECANFPYRLGKTPTERPRYTPLKSIRRFCVQCMGGQRYLVSKCLTSECRYFQYRLGKNPARKGLGDATHFAGKGRLCGKNFSKNRLELS